MAIIIVEDGTGVANANSYVSEAELITYATDRGITLTQEGDVLLIRAMDYLESLNYQGRKVSSSQALQWPRYGVYIDGSYFPSDEIPKELKQAQMALAVSIDAGQDPLSTSTQGIKRKKVDVLEIEYMDGSSSRPVIYSVNISLRKLLAGAGNNGANVVNVYRG